MSNRTTRALLSLIADHDADALGTLVVSERRIDVTTATLHGAMKTLSKPVQRDPLEDAIQQMEPEAAQALDKLLRCGGKLVDHARGYNSAGSVVTVDEHRDEVLVEGFDEFATRWEIIGHQLNAEVTA
jgi:hypothetical protein